jgi:hypothetical protein
MALALHGLAMNAYLENDLDAGNRLYEEALALHTEFDSFILKNMIESAYLTGGYARSIELLEQGVRLERARRI